MLSMVDLPLSLGFIMPSPRSPSMTKGTAYNLASTTTATLTRMYAVGRVKVINMGDDDDDDFDDNYGDVEEEEEEEDFDEMEDVERKRAIPRSTHPQITDDQRKEAEALYEDPSLMTHDNLNQIFRPMVDYNDFVVRYDDIPFYWS